VLHASKVSDFSSVYFLYVEPELVQYLPQACCLLKVTPLIEELVKHLANAVPENLKDGTYPQAITLLLDQLTGLPVEQTSFALPSHPKLKRIARELQDSPADRRTVAEWAELVAMGERSLERLFLSETGMTFGRFRQQLQLSIALQMLARQHTVESVAVAVGYESTSAFITMFKKKMGNSPRRYADLWKLS
jgi:transcriptional regulator GlxA family with amidase domain